MTISDLDQLLQDVTEMFAQQTFDNSKLDNVESKKTIINSQFQAPIKSTFYNSGNFSFAPTDARHPKGHMGVDMRAPAGTPIYPLTSGIVTNVGTDPRGGNVVNIQHPNNIRSYYAHCASIKVNKGDKVDNNTIIATVGDSGNAKGLPHLHFQVWENNQIQNPEKYFSMPPYSNYNPKKEKFWLSDDAKKDATSFNMKQHLNKTRTTLSYNVTKLLKIANLYYNLSIRS